MLDTSTADHLGYDRYPMAVVAPVAEFVAAGYSPVGVVDGVTIYRRNASPPVS